MSITSQPSIRHAATAALTISAAFLMAACGGGSSGESNQNKSAESETKTTSTATTTPTATTVPAPATVAASSAGSLGKTAWSNNCVACHGGDTSKGNNAAKIMSAIASNTGGMGILNGKISTTDANNIAAYAANPGAY